MSPLIRRFGPQALLLTSAFATAVLLAIMFRPARIAQADRGQPINVTAPAAPKADREAAQAKLAEAMARLSEAAPREPEAAVAAPAQIAPQMEALAPPAAPAEPEPTPEPKAVAPVASAPPPQQQQLSETDLRRLADKAAQAMRDGDVYGARLILEKSVEGGDARALLTLAETYDPRALARMNAKSVKPDPARARALYAQALEKGVTGARARLDALDR